MSQHGTLEPYELDFIRDTFADPSWSTAAIANKLERCALTVMKYGKLMGLSRPNAKGREISHDWPSIWYAHQANQSYSETARALGISGQVVCYAMRQMILMGTEERLKVWNKWAEKTGRERYTWEDANGMI